MVGVLVRMKLRVVRRTLRGRRAVLVGLGGLVGLGAAVGTVAVAAHDFATPAISVDVLSGMCLLWTIGWLLGPVFAGGVDTLRSEHFALLPAAPARLVGGLACAAFVGVPAVVGLVAFSGLVFFAAGHGVGPVLVAVLAALLQLTLVVVLAAVVATALGSALRWHVRVPLAGLLGGGVLVLLAATGPVLADGRSTELSRLVRTLPSGWGSVAVDAAVSSRWPVVLACLLGLGALVAVSLAGWADLLARRAGGVRVRQSDTPAGVAAMPDLPHGP